MKLVAMILLLSMAAFAVTVEPLPPSEYADTNVVITPEADWDGCHSFGTVGQSTLVTTNYIGPMNVSFQGIMVAEIPCYDIVQPTGYFATDT